MSQIATYHLNTHLPPTFERDAVCMKGLRRRADLNGCYGLVQSRPGFDAYEVRIGKVSILAKYANLDFVGNVSTVFDADGVTDEMMAKNGLVLDEEMRKKYLPEEFEPVKMTPDILAQLSNMGVTLCAE